MDKRWKATERKTAELLGATRNPNNGTHQIDINADGLAVEHKNRTTFPAWLEKAVGQAQGGAKPDEIPMVVVTHSRGRGRPQKRYVVMAFDDWLEWHGSS